MIVDYFLMMWSRLLRLMHTAISFWVEIAHSQIIGNSKGTIFALFSEHWDIQDNRKCLVSKILVMGAFIDDCINFVC